MNVTRVASVAALILTATSVHALGAQPAPSGQRTQRLQALARLDAAVHHFHPAVAVRQTDWDSAWAAQALRIADAPSTSAYGRRVRQLVHHLGDPATHVESGAAEQWVIAARRAENNVVVLRPRAQPATRHADASPLIFTAPATSAVVIDLRGHVGSFPDSLVASQVLGASAHVPAQQSLRYVGFPDTLFNSREAYYRAWSRQDGEDLSGQQERPVAFLVDAQSVLPPLALALRTQGRGAVIGVSTARVATAADAMQVDMGEGITVRVRLGRRVIDRGEDGVAVDTTADAADAEAVAQRWARRPVTPWREAPIDTAVVRMLAAPTSGPSSWSYPSRGYRLLAAARLWNSMALFFPYMKEARERWDLAFRAALPRIEHAQDSLAFAKEVARLATHLHDSHVRVYSRVLWRAFYGEVPTSAVVRLIGNNVVVIRIADSSAVRAGLSVGDVISHVDGEATAARIARLSPFFVSSTAQALRARLADFMLTGHDSTPARLTVRKADGRTHVVIIARSMAYPPPSYAINRDGPIVRLLPGNIGYVDLERLTVAMVDSTMSALAGARGIVFDGRGYPGSPAWVLIAARLNKHPDPTPAATFRMRIITSPDRTTHRDSIFTQPVRVAEGPRYSGRTALLIDERAISQAEHVGLHFEAANGTAFVGSTTMGADGGVTSIQLPGSLRVSFTGAEVRHGDGRPLQRVGLQPHVRVEATVAGIRAGRDEVLERAVACLLAEHCPAQGGK